MMDMDKEYLLNVIYKIGDKINEKRKSAFKMAISCFYELVNSLKDDILFLQRDTKYGKDYVNIPYDKFVSVLKNLLDGANIEPKQQEKIIKMMFALGLVNEDSYRKYRHIIVNNNSFRIVRINKCFTEIILDEIKSKEAGD